MNNNTSLTTNDVTTFIECLVSRIRQLEADVSALTEELETLNQNIERRLPEYRGFEFWLVELDPGWGKDADNPHYGYQLRKATPDAFQVQGGGAYATKHEATKTGRVSNPNLRSISQHEHRHLST